MHLRLRGWVGGWSAGMLGVLIDDVKAGPLRKCVSYRAIDVSSVLLYVCFFLSDSFLTECTKHTY